MNKKISRFFLSVMATVMLFSLMTDGDFTENALANPFTVTAQAAAQKIGLKKTKVTITTGTTYTLKLLDKKGKTISASKVKWSTSSKKIATVSKKGVVTGVKKGTATITATYKGKKYTCKVTVKNAALSATKKTLSVGKSFTLTLKDASGKKIDPKNVKWSTSKKSVATVSTKGVVKAVENGTATITATYKGKKYTCKITSIYTGLKYKSITLYLGETVTQTYYNSNGKKASDVRWGTENYSVANISYNGDGTVTPRGAGKARLYAQYNNEKYYFTVTVKEPKIKLSKTSATIKEGSTLKLTATTTPANKAVTWSTSDKNIATVSSKGVVTPLRAGTCEIIAKYKYGSYSYNYVEAKCKITTVFEGSDLRAPLSAQSGKIVTLQKFTSDPSYKVKVNITKVVRGSQANQLVLKENQNNKTTSGYEWCLIYTDIEHISNSKGSNTPLEAVDILYKDDLFTSSGASVPVQKLATFSHELKGMGIFDVDIYPGGVGSVILGVLIPSSTGDILLRVPNMSSNTWIKLPAPTDLPTGGSSGGISPPAPVLGTPAENLSAVKAYINKNGTSVSSGEVKRITDTRKNDNYTYKSEIEYNSTSGSIWYSLNVYEGSKMINTLIFSFSDTTSAVNVTAIIYSLGTPNGTLSFYPSAYKSGVDRSFSWTSVGGSTLTESERNSIGSALLDVGFALFDVIIYEKTGISITDIGFSSY